MGGHCNSAAADVVLGEAKPSYLYVMQLLGFTREGGDYYFKTTP